MEWNTPGNIGFLQRPQVFEKTQKLLARQELFASIVTKQNATKFACG